MEINLIDNVPVVVPHRQIPRPLYEEVKNFINDLIANRWVRESKSSYASPIVCVRKKDQSLRLCIDYRALNKKIITDKQPIPRIQEIFDGLGGQEWFSMLDMAKAYHQGYVGEQFRKYTAFSTPWGLYEWIRIPMGISTAPPAFQRFINQTLYLLRDRVCTAYLDDVLIYGRSFEEHVENLRLVLRRLKSRGIKLRADKCKFFQLEVRYLGRLISKQGHRPDPKDTAALDKFKTPPTTIGELRTLLGFLGYYRSYIQNFSREFQPIYQLLKSDPKSKKIKNNKRQQKNSKTTIEWTADMQKVVDDTVEYLQSPEFLVFPEFSLPFVLNCDASELGLGAVLYQKQGCKDRVVSYASRTLTDSERNYHLHSGKLEFLSLKWAVTEKFYLCWSCSGPAFTVFTDNNPLTYVMSTAKLNATGLRWVAELSNFQFEIKYKPGKKNGDADGLSRMPMSLEELEKVCTEKMRFEDLSTIMEVRRNSSPTTCSERVDVSMLELSGTVDRSPISKDEIRKEQVEDEVVGPAFKCVKKQKRPTKEEWKEWSKKSKVMMHQYKKLSIEDGMLVRETTSRKQLVLPAKFHNLVFEELHCKMGHLGSEKVEELARQRFYWPYMQSDIESFIRKKCTCIADKQQFVPEKAPLVPIISSAPFELVCIDFLHLDKHQGHEYVLLVTDHFTRFTQAYPTKDRKSLTAAAKLFNDFIPKFGFPDKIHHDRGQEFNSELFEELHRLAGIQMSNTTPHHPMGNGAAERMNRTLIGMLRSVPEDQKCKWKDHLPALLFAYNSTVNKSTGYSPFFLTFGRESRLPIDCILPLEPNRTRTKSYNKFVKDWKDSMRDAFQITSQNIETAAKANKRRYDAKIKTVQINVGDRVLVRNKETGGTGKMRSWWLREIYKVIEVYDLVPVFVIQPIDGRPTKTVHRNMLMLVNYMPLDTFGQIMKPAEENKTKKNPKRRPLRKKVTQSAVGSDSDSDGDLILYIPTRDNGVPEDPQAVLDVVDVSSDSDSDFDDALEHFESIHGSDSDPGEVPVPNASNDGSTSSTIAFAEEDVDVLLADDTVINNDNPTDLVNTLIHDDTVLNNDNPTEPVNTLIHTDPVQNNNNNNALELVNPLINTDHVQNYNNNNNNTPDLVNTINDNKLVQNNTNNNPCELVNTVINNELNNNLLQSVDAPHHTELVAGFPPPIVDPSHDSVSPSLHVFVDPGSVRDLNPKAVEFIPYENVVTQPSVVDPVVAIEDLSQPAPQPSDLFLTRDTGLVDFQPSGNGMSECSSSKKEGEVVRDESDQLESLVFEVFEDPATEGVLEDKEAETGAVEDSESSVGDYVSAVENMSSEFSESYSSESYHSSSDASQSDLDRPPLPESRNITRTITPQGKPEKVRRYPRRVRLAKQVLTYPTKGEPKVKRYNLLAINSIPK